MRLFDQTSIRRLREEKGLTVVEFGKRLGVSRQHARELEKMVGKPNIKTIERLMDTFGVDETYFFISKTTHN